MSDSTIRMIAVGDLAFNAAYHRLLERQGSDFVFRAVRDDWKHAELRFGNLESPISHHQREAESKLTLRGSPLAVDSLISAGFDCVSLANNHMMDFGPDGLIETCNLLDSAGIAHVGAGRNLDEAMAPAVFNCRGRSVGVLAFCDVEQISPLYATGDSPGVAPADLDVCRRAIASLRDEVDHVVVHMHWGQEMCRLPTPKQRQWAVELANAGVDVVLGHHPHVVQPLETINGSAVAYSLGDFLFSDTFWHGTNGSGKPFVAHYQVHPLSRRTGWMQFDLAAERPVVASFQPAQLNRDLSVTPQDAPSRRKEWNRLVQDLTDSNYQRLFDEESSQANIRERWRMDYRRLVPRLRLWLLRHGFFPNSHVEPDGANWRERYRELLEISEQGQKL